MRERILNRLAGLSERRPGTLLLIALIITVMAAGLSETLKLEMQFKNLMPQDHPMVEGFNEVVDNFSTATMIIVAAKGDENELKKFAEEVAPKIEEMTNFVQHVDYKIEKDFYLKHGMMLQKAKDLKNSKDLYSDLSLLPFLTHLNDNFEKTYVYEEESISNKEKENNAIRFLDGLKTLLTTMELYSSSETEVDSEVAENAVEKFLIGDEYYLSQKKNMLLLFARPTFSINELDKVLEAENKIDSVIFDVAKNYPSIFAGTTGTMALSRDETEAMNSDMYITSLIAFILIIALFILSFRMWVAPVLAGITLLIGIIWTAGFTAVTLGSLNIMTSMFAVILMGLGIDFSIHIITVYTESRAAGESIGDSLRTTFYKSGKGVITGGITTAVAFLTLIVSETDGMKEFGIVAGSGVLFCMAATIFVLPAMLSLRDKLMTKIRKDKYKVRSTDFVFIGNVANAISKKPVIYLLVMGVITVVLFVSAINITFDYNYLNMEPVGLTSIILQDEMEEEFDVTPDFALVTVNTVEEARKIAEDAKDLKMVGMVSSITEYIPSDEEQAKRIPIIEEIRNSLTSNTRLSRLNKEKFDEFIDQLYRIEDNVIELSQLSFLGGQDKVDDKCKELLGDLDDEKNVTMISQIIEKISENRERTIANLNRFNDHFEPSFREMSIGMTSTDQITLETLPENVYDQFVSNDESKYLVTVYPKDGVWKNMDYLERFTNQMSKIDERMTGMPSVFYVLIGIIANDGEIAFMLTLIVVFLLLFYDFKSAKYALLAMIPLVVGVIWMVGVMQMAGLQLTMLNMMGLPLIIGIGIDDGVHLLHRYKIEGRSKIKTVFTSTGKAVMLTSITTMLAFGSFVFATYRGMGSLGIALFIGVGTCFLTSVLILPALLSLTEKANKQVEN